MQTLFSSVWKNFLFISYPAWLAVGPKEACGIDMKFIIPFWLIKWLRDLFCIKYKYIYVMANTAEQWKELVISKVPKNLPFLKPQWLVDVYIHHISLLKQYRSYTDLHSCVSVGADGQTGGGLHRLRLILQLLKVLAPPQWVWQVDEMYFVSQNTESVWQMSW